MINELRMDELKNLFFYTFGIVPLQYYNAIGDGFTDNRLKIQQAIYDAIEVKAKYIYVPKGNYYYSQSLFKTSEVIFIGNSVDTKIEGVTIRQFPDLWGENQNSTGAIIPVGGIILYAGETIPSNFLECNGATLNIADYTSLYEVLTNDSELEIKNQNGIDILVGSGNSTTFTIPTVVSENLTVKYIIRVR